MRNRIVVMIMVGMMSIISLVGCGKTEEEKAAEDLGITLEEYQDLKNFISYDEEEIDIDDAEADDVQEQKEETVLTYEASNEIIGAKFTDMKFQIDDQVFTMTYGDSLSKFMNQLTDVYICGNANGEELSIDKLVAPGDKEAVYIYNQNQPDNAGWCVYLEVRNSVEDSSINLSECSLVNMDLNPKYEGDIYFAKGIPFNSEKLASDNNYSYENIPNLLATFDLENFDNHDYEEGTGNCGRQYIENGKGGLVYTIHAYASEDTKYWNGNTWGEQKFIMRPNYSITLKMDENSRACSEIKFCYSSVSNWE